MTDLIPLDTTTIADLVQEIRGQRVILDADLARLFGTETKKLNQQVRRNIERFEERFAFQLTAEEFADLRSRDVTARAQHGGRRTPPIAFTEHGIAMAATVTTSPRAVEAVKLIIDIFVAARRQLASGAATPVVDPAVVEQRRTIRMKLAQMAERILDAEINRRDGTTVRQEVAALTTGVLDAVKAQLDSKPLQNQQLVAEIRHKIAEAEKIEAETRKTHAEADRLDIDNMKERLALLTSIEDRLSAEDPARLIAAMDAVAGRPRIRTIDASPVAGKKN